RGALLEAEPLALLAIHLLADARSLAQVPIGAALGEQLLVRLRRSSLRRLPIRDLDAEGLLDEVAAVHPHRVVVGEQRAHLDADVAADALLKAVLDGLVVAATGERPGRERLDAADRAELRALAARKAEVDVH